MRPACPRFADAAWDSVPHANRATQVAELLQRVEAATTRKAASRAAEACEHSCLDSFVKLAQRLLSAAVHDARTYTNPPRATLLAIRSLDRAMGARVSPATWHRVASELPQTLNVLTAHGIPSGVTANSLAAARAMLSFAERGEMTKQWTSEMPTSALGCLIFVWITLVRSKHSHPVRKHEQPAYSYPKNAAND